MIFNKKVLAARVLKGRNVVRDHNPTMFAGHILCDVLAIGNYTANDVNCRSTQCTDHWCSEFTFCLSRTVPPGSRLSGLNWPCRVTKDLQDVAYLVVNTFKRHGRQSCSRSAITLIQKNKQREEHGCKQRNCC